VPGGSKDGPGGRAKKIPGGQLPPCPYTSHTYEKPVYFELRLAVRNFLRIFSLNYSYSVLNL